MKYKKFILECLEISSKIALKYFGKLDHSVKAEDPNQVLTEADLLIGERLIGKVTKKYPNHNIVDEEKGVIDNNSDYSWIIDPIDGTSNFAVGAPMFGIFIGLLRKNKPVAGGLVLPCFEEFYIAERKKGCYLNGKKISATSEKKLINSLVSYSIDSNKENPSMTRKETKILAEIILAIRNLRMSNSCFDTAMVVKGVYGAYLNQGSKIWDNVAQQILVEEAGGVCTTFFGDEIDYHDHLSNPEKNFTFCIGASQTHKQLQEIIKKYRD